MNIKDKANNSSTFCLLPFIHMATKTDGDMKLCCRSWPVDNIANTTIKELWNSDKYKDVRRQMLNGERPEECHACWRHEDIGVRSMRQRYNKSRSKRYLPRLENMADDYSMPFEIPILEAKLSNFCNLKCRMCHPLDSTSWSKDWTEIEHLMEDANESTFTKVREYNLTRKPYVSGWENNEDFWKEFEELAPYFERIEFAGGEPLIDPIHYKILHILKPYGENIEIKYSTNLTKLNYKKDNILDLWHHFKEININVSIDGIYDVYDYIRQLGDYNIVKENIQKVRNHPKVSQMVGACTVQVYNVEHLPEIADEFIEQLGLVFHTHRVNYPKFLDCRVIPTAHKDFIINKLQNYLESIDSKNWPKEIITNTKSHIEDAIASLQGGDMTEQLPAFIEFSNKLDAKQNVKKTWQELLPNLKESIDELTL